MAADPVDVRDVGGDPRGAGARVSRRQLRVRWSEDQKCYVPVIAADASGSPHSELWDEAEPIALVGLFILALAYTAYLAQPLLVPVILAWVVGTILLPIVERLERWGVPRTAAGLLTGFAVVVLVLGVFALLSVPVAFWVGRASEIGNLIRAKLSSLSEPLKFLSELRQTITAATNTGDGPAVRIEQTSGSIITSVLGTLTPAVSQTVLFVGALIFYLIYQKSIRTQLVRVVRDRATRLSVLRVLGDIEDNMSIYFGTYTIVNLCLAVLVALISWWAGLPNPLLWGVLAGVLNYLPYIGPALITATLFIAGLLSFPALFSALVAPVAFVCLSTLEGNFITPTIVGQRLTLNPFLIFLAIAFWTWLWGPVGAFLAVPLVITGQVIVRHTLIPAKPNLPE